MDDVWAEVFASRDELADLLETLTPEQWEAQSLCDQWKVRDVVGHIVLGAGKLGFGKTIADLAKSGFSMNKMLARTGMEKGRVSTEELVKELREQSTNQYTPPMTKPIDMLSDTVVHTQDIRRPLDKPKEIPEDRLRAVLEDMKNVGFMGNKKRIAGLKFVATDMTWTHGEGPEVQGKGEALLLAMCGRPTVLDELSGDGVETLRTRLN
jgi:uncharacterized protein (TIGR03083 family)